MATSSIPFLVVSLLAAAAATAAARPCKTLFYISATTKMTYYPYKSLNRKTDPDSVLLIRNLPRSLTLVFTETTRFTNRRSSLNFASVDQSDVDSRASSEMFPLKFYSSVSSSIRDRTRDILSVVGALIFGVGCGVLTGLSVYLLCALFSSHLAEFDGFSSCSEDDDEDDVTVAKKLGYVEIPTKPKMMDDELKKPMLPSKEVV